MEAIKVYTLKEVAELLKTSERTLLTYLKDKKLKGNKIGGKWIITHEKLQDFINGK